MHDTLSKLLPEAELSRLEAHFPERIVAVGGGAQVAVRDNAAPAAGLPLVCLHGIGSGAPSWMQVAQLLAPTARLVAWDAPGYGDSTPLPRRAPRAADYAQRLHALLDALDIGRCVLVGHSLGALVAAHAARPDGPLADRLAALVLISPAQGYGAPGKGTQRARVHIERLTRLAALGIGGMAAARSHQLLSDQASPLARQWVHWNMARLHEAGYRQAIELLCGADLLADLPSPGTRALPTTVACGTHDTVTPPAGCAEVAAHCGVPLQPIDGAGHACYVEQPDAVADLLTQVLATAHNNKQS